MNTRGSRALLTLDDARELRSNPELIFDAVADLVAGGPLTLRTADIDADGRWDPDTRTIWLHHDLTPAARRCTLAHELIHAVRGDSADPEELEADAAAREELVEGLTAVLLVGIRELARAAAANPSVRSKRRCADALGVDVAILEARRRNLTDDERAALGQRPGNRRRRVGGIG